MTIRIPGNTFALATSARSHVTRLATTLCQGPTTAVALDRAELEVAEALNDLRQLRMHVRALRRGRLPEVAPPAAPAPLRAVGI